MLAAEASLFFSRLAKATAPQTLLGASQGATLALASPPLWALAQATASLSEATQPRLGLGCHRQATTGTTPTPSVTHATLLLKRGRRHPGEALTICPATHASSPHTNLGENLGHCARPRDRWSGFHVDSPPVRALRVLASASTLRAAVGCLQNSNPKGGRKRNQRRKWGLGVGTLIRFLFFFDGEFSLVICVVLNGKGIASRDFVESSQAKNAIENSSKQIKVMKSNDFTSSDCNGSK